MQERLSVICARAGRSLKQRHRATRRPHCSSVGSDPARFGAMRARFSKPTMPGDTLTISVWDIGDRAAGAYRFRTETQRGETVIDAGLFQLAP